MRECSLRLLKPTPILPSLLLFSLHQSQLVKFREYPLPEPRHKNLLSDSRETYAPIQILNNDSS